MAASHPLFEPEMQEKTAQVVEANAGVAPTPEDPEQRPLMPSHVPKLPHRVPLEQSCLAGYFPPQNVMRMSSGPLHTPVS